MNIRRFLPPRALAFVIVLMLVGVFLCLMNMYRFQFQENDYSVFIRQNVLLFWQGQDPYLGPGPYNPPWLYLILGPLLFLPDPAGAAVLTMLNLLVLAWLLKRSRASLLVLFMALFSPVVLSLVMTSNVDGILLLGVLLPPQWGLFLVLAKPQMGVGIALYWAWQAFHTGGIRRLVQVFAPVSVAFLISFAVYGIYLLRGTLLVSAGWNVNKYLFPYMVVPALILLFFALRSSRISLSYGVGPLISPYATPNSYIGLIPAFAWDWRWAIAIWLLEWGVFLLHFLR